MKCIKSTYALFEQGKDYDLKHVGDVGRYAVYEYTDPESGYVYKFGLDDNGENETDGNFMKFEV